MVYMDEKELAHKHKTTIDKIEKYLIRYDPDLKMKRDVCPCEIESELLALPLEELEEAVRLFGEFVYDFINTYERKKIKVPFERYKNILLGRIKNKDELTPKELCIALWYEWHNKFNNPDRTSRRTMYYCEYEKAKYHHPPSRWRDKRERGPIFEW